MTFHLKNFFAFFYKTSVDFIIYSLILAIILGLLPNSLFKDYPLAPKSYSTNFPDKLDKWNNDLSTKSQLLLNGLVNGPESLAEKDGFIYTGLLDGRLIEINKKSLKTRDVAKFGVGPICDNPSDCGRILGVRFNRDGYLYALDYYNGLFKVNVSTGQIERIPVSDQHIIGFDDLEFDPKLNVVYISMLSTKWSLDKVLHGLIDFDDSGYVFAYNFDTKTSIKLRTGIPLSNGLQLTKDKKHLLMAESMGYRIMKTSIESLHKAIKENRLLADNEIEVFATLPGEPDNIRLDSNGDVLVSMFSVRNNGKHSMDYLSEWPFIRKIIGRSVYSSAVAIDFVNTKLFGSKWLSVIASDLYSGDLLLEYLPKRGAVIKLDAKSGKIKRILGSELFGGVTEALVDSKGDLYFGSFVSPFLGRIKKGDH